MTRWPAVALLVVLLAVARLGAQEPGDGFRCKYLRRSFCTADGCSAMPKDSEYVTIPRLEQLEAVADSSAVNVRRCGQNGCTAVPTLIAREGAFLHLNSSTHGFLLTIGTAELAAYGFHRGDFVEVITIYANALVSSGSCQPQ